MWTLRAQTVPAATTATSATTEATETPDVQDVLFFKDGDRLTGNLVRIEDGAVIFRTNKTAELTIQFDAIRDLRCITRFAVLRRGIRVNARNAVIGRIELRGEDLMVRPQAGSAQATITLKAAEVEYAIDDATFEREVSRHTPLREGWTITASAGASLVRATENGTALNTSALFVRAIPGVSYLPRRSRLELGVTETYDLVSAAAIAAQPARSSETNTFHAGAEYNAYVHAHLYLLGDYTFDRNYAQGLQAQHLFGGGVGWTVVQDSEQQLDVKTDFHYEIQGFTANSDNDHIVGQKLAFEYKRDLLHGLRFQEAADYLPSYTDTHKYSANSTTTLTVPLYRRLGLAVTLEDNYLNNSVPGLRRNTFRASTGLTFSK